MTAADCPVQKMEFAVKGVSGSQMDLHASVFEKVGAGNKRGINPLAAPDNPYAGQCMPNLCTPTQFTTFGYDCSMWTAGQVQLLSSGATATWTDKMLHGIFDPPNTCSSTFEPNNPNNWRLEPVIG